MRCTVVRSTPNRTASFGWEMPPSRARRRISRTASSVSFAIPLRSPLDIFSRCMRGPLLSPQGRLPFRTQSSMFSWWVPRKRWIGFTQSGSSPSGQLWQTYIPSGIGCPECSTQLTRCDLYVRRRIFNRPYPLLVLPLVHNQQSCGPPFATWDQNRASTSAVICDRRLSAWFVLILRIRVRARWSLQRLPRPPFLSNRRTERQLKKSFAFSNPISHKCLVREASHELTSNPRTAEAHRPLRPTERQTRS